MKYIISKLWPLILLLAVSIIVVCSKLFTGLIYDFFFGYLCFAIYVLSIGIVSGLLGSLIPRKFDPTKGIFRCFSFEKGGSIYEDIFHIKRWKDRAFDISKAFSNIEKKSLVDKDSFIEKTNILVQETCVAEVVHWFLILISPLMLLLCHNVFMIIFWVIYLCMNLMDIMIQRYNRPRLLKIVNKKSRT